MASDIIVVSRDMLPAVLPDDIASSVSGDDENHVNSTAAARNHSRVVSNAACAHILGLPDVFTELHDHYHQFGFFDNATSQGMLRVMRPFIRVHDKTKRQRRAAPAGQDHPNVS